MELFLTSFSGVMAPKLPINRGGRSQRGGDGHASGYNTRQCGRENPSPSQSEEESEGSTSSTSSSIDEAAVNVTPPEPADIEIEDANVEGQAKAENLET